MGEQSQIRIYQTAERSCGYWPDRIARDLVLDPTDPKLPALYGTALALGYRRSGHHVYRPNCAQCNACVPARIPVDRFLPSRSQRRCMAKNADLQLSLRPAERNSENFALYREYVGSRHAGGGMDNPGTEDFDAFLSCPWSPTVFLEMRLGRQLLAIAATDRLPSALSAVYTFFAPEHAARSLGTFAILSQVDYARQEGLEFVYLGFWLDGHPKMHYKQSFRPLEILVGREWQTIKG